MVSENVYSEIVICALELYIIVILTIISKVTINFLMECGKVEDSHLDFAALIYYP